jgi:dTDP-4-amino-4,6-dideoxygalactose transaminase
MVNILGIAKRNNLLVIEDAAQAHLAEFDGTTAGSFGDAAAFSFYPTKNMTSGEGGMISTSSDEVARQCRLLRNQGMEKRYENEIVGFNLRMTDIHASIGRVQLSKLVEKTQRRQENAAFLSENILKSVEVPIFPSGYSHVFHQYTIQLVGLNRNELQNYLEGKGIPSMIYYPKPAHKQDMFDGFKVGELDLPVTESLTSSVISLPIHTEMTVDQQKFICAEILDFININK